MGEGDATMNYAKHVMNQTLLITSKSIDQHGLGT